MQKIDVSIEGLAPFMFNRFIDHSKEVRPAEQKIYLTGDNEVVLPAENLVSFVCGSLVPGCAKSFEGKKSKEYIRVAYSHISFSPNLIPFTSKGKPVILKNLDDKCWGICMSGGITKGSGGSVVKQEAQPRPFLNLPWELSFTIALVQNPIIDSTKLHNWFDNGGILIALGAFRPVYGRFIVKKWKES